jgi:hypothetical protein
MLCFEQKSAPQTKYFEQTSAPPSSDLKNKEKWVPAINPALRRGGFFSQIWIFFQNKMSEEDVTNLITRIFNVNERVCCQSVGKSSI